MCIYSLLRLVALKCLLHLHNMSVLSYVYLLSLPKCEIYVMIMTTTSIRNLYNVNIGWFIETGSTEVFGAFA